MTNRQMMEISKSKILTNESKIRIKGVDDESVQDIVCEYCNTYVIKSHPPGFVCEGRFCDEAWDKWLDEEWEDEDDEV